MGVQQTELAKSNEVSLRAGTLNTTLDAHALSDDQAQSKFNCRTQRGIWECDLRYRNFQSKGNKNPVGISIWERGTNGSHIFTVRQLTSDSKYYLIMQPASDSLSSATTATTVHQAVDFDGSSDCVVWQAGDRLHIVDGLGVLWYVEPATNSKYHISPQYRDYEANVSDGVATTDRPPYDGAVVPVATYGSGDTITDLQTIRVTPGAWSTSANAMSSTHTATHSGDPGWWSFEIVWSGNQDWSNVETLYIPFSSGAAGKKSRLEGQANATIIEIEDAAGHTKRIPYIKSMGLQTGNGPYLNYVTYSLRDNGSVDLATIKKLRIYTVWSVYTETGLVFTVGPMQLGGKYMNRRASGDRLYDASLYLDDIKYAYRYRNTTLNAGTDPTSAVGVLGWYESTLIGLRALGENSNNAMPRGAWANVAPPVNDPDTFPYGTGGGQYNVVDVCRRIWNGAAWNWVRLNGVTAITNRANTGDTPSWEDKLDHTEIWAAKTSQTDHGTGDTPTGGATYNPNTSGQVKNMSCGCFWKGCNIVASKSGKIHMSKSNDFRTVLWDNVNIGPLDSTLFGNPRTVDLGIASATPILSLVGQDALYAVSRTAVFAFVGIVPSAADGPYRLQDVRGCLGKKAVTPFKDGVLIASDDGLWLIVVPPTFAGSTSEFVIEEVTKDVRDTYAWLLLANDGTTDCRTEVCIAHHAGHIWMFNRNKYMHRSLDGEWSYGQWADSRWVKQCVTHHQYGILLTVVDSDGTNFAHGCLGDFQKDGGTNALGANGTAVDWYYETGFNTEDLSVNAVRVTALTITAVTAVVTSQLSTRTLTFTDALQHKRPQRPCGGRYFKLKITGKGTDKVYSVKIQVARRGDNRGNVAE